MLDNSAAPTADNESEKIERVSETEPNTLRLLFPRLRKDGIAVSRGVLAALSDAAEWTIRHGRGLGQVLQLHRRRLRLPVQSLVDPEVVKELNVSGLIYLPSTSLSASIRVSSTNYQILAIVVVSNALVIYGHHYLLH